MLDLTLLSPDHPYLLAISGGRDSVALLHLLLKSGYRNLHLVHLNHQLRGAESDADAEFVKKLAEAFQLSVIIQKADVAKAAAESNQSLETTARLARHQLFHEVARTTNCTQILLAHHADDQAETILFNLFRGSAGLKGMKPRATIKVGDDSLTLLRPLLQLRRSEINAYLSDQKIDFREDHSNAELDFTRNRLRHEALPLLADILKRDIVPTLNRAAEIGQENDEIVQTQLQNLNLLDPQGRLFLPTLRDLPTSLQKAALRQYLKTNTVSKVSHQMIVNAVTMIPPEGPSKLNLPGNRFLRRKEGRVFLEN